MQWLGEVKVKSFIFAIKFGYGGQIRFQKPATANSQTLAVILQGDLMIDTTNIKDYITDFPKVWSFLGSPEQASEISSEHKDQIHFLNPIASSMLNNFLWSSCMLEGLDPHKYDGKTWNPFRKNYFREMDEFRIVMDCDSAIKKWLFARGIPFDKYVFIDSVRSGQSVMLTWKMVIKYWEGLFFADDLTIFDETLNWGLFYFHESHLYYGQTNIFNPEEKIKEMEELNELKKKYPFLKFPY
ncbi:MAG: hypothetical protein ACK5R0_13855 [Bacteroidota bacterium]